MKKFFKYNVGAAVGALVLIVLLGIFGGVNRTVYSYKSKTENAFFSSEGSAASDLKKYAEFASKLSAIAKANGCDTDKLDKNIVDLDNGSPFKECGKALQNIASSASVVYNELASKKDVDEQQSRSAKSYYAEMDSTVMRLKNNSAYNSAAAKYNKAKNSFPANILTWNTPDAAVFDK